MERAYDIVFAPRLPAELLWIAGIAVLVAVGIAFAARARGAWIRAAAFAVLLLALLNPLIVREAREGLTNVVALVIDRSQSQEIGTRQADAEAALADIREELAKMPNLEDRETEAGSRSDSADGGGTAAFAAVMSALADVPPDRVAGAILITDGEIHDAPEPAKYPFKAPLHTLLTGAPGERDRKLTVVRAARFGIVGEPAELTLKVEDFGAGAGGHADVRIRVDGKDQGVRILPVGEEDTIKVDVAHGGENVIEIEAGPGPAELTLQNNRAVVVLNGVRDRLRVLLVSGEPHAGERVWRNLLKADPSVDLVHFTILRPPEKQDGTPINELSLIAFPTRELFNDKLAQFDLVIFDRYRRRGILPLAYYENIARYVENGGALLLSSGPEFAQPTSIYRTPLAAVLPAQPTGEVIEVGFRPLVTKTGLAHPVTRELPAGNTASEPPSWGRWFRILGTEKLGGVAVMDGPGERPLLVLDRIEKGRVAQILSDQPWLWARGFEGGGPQAELLRRLAHWLMKEPDLEEERLSARIANGEIEIVRRTMADETPPVSVTLPGGEIKSVPLEKTEAGRFVGRMKAEELGLYRLSDGKLSAVAAAGPLNPREVADVRATPDIVAPIAKATGGATHWLKDGVPGVRRVAEGRIAGGAGWIGLVDREAYRVMNVEQEQLLPGWLALLLILGTVVLAWRQEGR